MTAVKGMVMATDIPAVTEADNLIIEYNTYITHITHH